MIEASKSALRQNNMLEMIEGIFKEQETLDGKKQLMNNKFEEIKMMISKITENMEGWLLLIITKLNNAIIQSAQLSFNISFLGFLFFLHY
jgi:hypothetical protein